MPSVLRSTTARSRVLVLSLSPLLAALLTTPATAAPLPPDPAPVVRASSAAAAAEEGVDLTATTPPEISGTPVVGQTLAVTAPGWSELGVTTTYQWLRDGVEVPGATGTSYVLEALDVDRTLSVVAVGTSEGGSAPVPTTSAPFGPVLKITPSLAVSATSSRPGAVDITVTVAAPGEVVGGAVTLEELGSELTGTDVVDGQAVLHLQGAAPGAHSYDVTYGGTDRIAAGSQPVAVDVQDRLVSTMTTSATSSAIGKLVLTLTVKAGGSPVVGGTVTIAEEDATVTPALTLSQGTATWSASGLKGGRHTYTVHYSGTATVQPLEIAVPVTVKDRAVSTVSASGTSSAVGRLALTATVRSEGPAVISGTVAIIEGGKTVASKLPISAGKASWSATGLPSGRHTYTVRYSGNTTTKPGEDTVTVTVRDRAASVVSASGTSSAVGRIALTATIRSGGKAVSSGTATVLEGERTLATKIRVSAGKVTWSATGRPSGRHTYTVRYSGNTTIKPGEDTVAVTVRSKAASSVGIKASSPAAGKVRLAITVRASGQSSLGGTVKITEGSLTLKAAVKVSRGKASWSASKVAPGRHTYTATYSGTSQVARGSGKASVTVRQIVVIQEYANCDAMHADWPHGVGRSGAQDEVSGSSEPVTNFLVNTALYNENTKSDRDGDGVACEAH